MPRHCCGFSAMVLSHHCQVCRSPDVRAVNEALMRGEKDAACARRWKLDPDAVRRHRIKGHLPPVGAQPGFDARAGPSGIESGETAETLGEKVRNAIIMIGSDARSHGDKRLALAAFTAAMDAIEKLERIRGRLGGGVTIGTMNLALQVNSFVQVQSAILTALADEPTARAKVLLALETIEHEEVPR
jgi:hypothetical protein